MRAHLGGRDQAHVDQLTITSGHVGPLVALAGLVAMVWLHIGGDDARPGEINHTTIVKEGRTEGRVVAPDDLSRLLPLIDQPLTDLQHRTATQQREPLLHKDRTAVGPCL